MIRVLHVIGAMDRGGAETMIMNLYRAIDRTSVQFDFLVHETRTCDYDEEIESLGGKLYRAPRFNGINGLSYRRAVSSLLLDSDAHPIVHGHIGSSAALYLSEAKRAGRFAIAHSHAQNFPASPSEYAFRALSYPTRFVADYFFACSREAGIDRFGEKIVGGSAFKILKNGIDLAPYRCDQSEHEACKQLLGYNADSVLIGHVGRLTEVKNHPFLFKTFSAFKQTMPEARLVCVGRGSLEGRLKEQVVELGLGDSVDFLGVREDVPSLMKAFDGFVFPSLKEGLPVAAVEAQASGLPVLLSTGVSQDAVITGAAERLSLSEGPVVWAEHLARSLNQNNPRHDRIDEVRGRGFDIKDSARWLEQFYLHVEEEGFSA